MNNNRQFLTWISLLTLLLVYWSCKDQQVTEASVQKVEVRQATNGSSQANIKQYLKYTSGTRCILEDRQGNYWFGSHQEGVCRFDGKSFTYFTVEDGLSANQVRTIREDQNGLIWFGTSDGISSYDGKDFTNYNSNLNKTFTTPKSKAAKWTTINNKLWFNAGNKPGVYHFDGQNLHYLPFPVAEQNQAFNHYGTTAFSIHPPDKIWIATYAAVFGYDGQSFESIDDQTLDFIEKGASMHVRSILEDSKGNLWIGNNGIGVLLKQEDQIINFSAQQGLTGHQLINNSFTSPSGTLEHVFAIYEDHQGNIWFGDRDTGAWKYDGQLMYNYTVGLPVKHIWSIYENTQRELLFAMGDGSVCKFNGQSFERKF